MSDDQQTKIVRVGSFKAKDPTPKTVFRNVAYRFKNGGQVLDVISFCDDVYENRTDDRDFEMTKQLRLRTKSLGRFFKMSKLKQLPMLTAEDGASLLLPRDNSVGLDYLTFRHPLYKAFITDLVNELYRHGNKDEQEASRVLLVDYSANAPFASCLRRDGRMSVPDLWNTDCREVFKDSLAKMFFSNFSEAESDPVHYMPPKNATKSVGFFDRFPNGEIFSRDHDAFVPESLKGNCDLSENLWVRYNHYPLKKAWLEDGLVDNLKFFLDNCARYDEFDTYFKAFTRCCCSVHTEAYRLNNGDPAKNDLSKGVEACIAEGLFKKGRVVSYEKRDGSFVSGVLRDQQYSNELKKVNPGLWGVLLKKRPMFPGPNATFSLPFILLFRFLIGPSEDCPAGFPSNRDKVLERYRTTLTSKAGHGIAIVTYDRSTSEQFITDNIEMILSFFPDRIQLILNALLNSVVPSINGPRFVKGLLSGTAATTFLNAVVGLIETCHIVCQCAYGDLTAPHVKECAEKIFQVFDHYGTVEINGLCFLINLGTDDQIFYCFSQTMNSAQLQDFLKKRLPESFSKKRFLTLDVTDSATVFGLKFTLTDVDCDSTLGLSKLWLFEKDKLGDKIAVKYDARLSLLTPYHDLLRSLFRKYGFGSINDYVNGAENYFRQLSHFGYKGFPDVWNEHSPSEKIIMGQYLQKYDIDPTAFVDRFSFEEMKPFVESFKKFLGVKTNEENNH